MKPSWLIVEYARTFLISLCASAIVAAPNAVTVPSTSATIWAVGEDTNSGHILATRNTPAATIVAAWIRAETGVGPSMASGSQMWSGN